LVLNLRQTTAPQLAAKPDREKLTLKKRPGKTAKRPRRDRK